MGIVWTWSTSALAKKNLWLALTLSATVFLTLTECQCAQRREQQGKLLSEAAVPLAVDTVLPISNDSTRIPRTLNITAFASSPGSVGNQYALVQWKYLTVDQAIWILSGEIIERLAWSDTLDSLSITRYIPIRNKFSLGKELSLGQPFQTPIRWMASNYVQEFHPHNVLLFSNPDYLISNGANSYIGFYSIQHKFNPSA